MHAYCRPNGCFTVIVKQCYRPTQKPLLVFYSPLKSLNINPLLRLAIENHTFRKYFNKIITFLSGHYPFECLAKMVHDMALLLPMTFSKCHFTCHGQPILTVLKLMKWLTFVFIMPLTQQKSSVANFHCFIKS